ncbi:hypothetical protein [Halobacillus sp. Nhm2S1]|uniref:hypothetical protein n=1 Tax=Halobacillus sp. Nhm2S1 TaxID=2866716 RepID=UPI001C73B9C6|nr:hypothetical protein [Halobacillus sp. Nhm2S1]MBX0359550.1 hypothetical protein [Halobacillus sp. Nhm2S1]
MQSNKFKKRFLLTFSVLLLLSISVYFGPSVLGGYAITEHSAIRYTFPNQDGEIVFEKELEDEKIVIWHTGRVNFIKVIEKPLGILKRVTNIISISGQTDDEKMNITWSGSKINDKGIYDVVVAAEVLDKEIEKVIVSNEQNDKKSTPLSVVKEQSSVFIEMDVSEGFAVHKSRLPNADVGSFSFRGLNSEGEIVSFDIL